MPKPVPPANMKEHSVDGAYAFLSFWLASLNYLMMTGNPAPIEHIYYNGYGARVSGWLKDAGSWYYLDPSTGAMATGWAQVDGTWYFFNASGAMRTGWQHAGSWYYLAPSGAMLTGWQHIGSTWYYFAGDGHMVTGWQTIDGRWYYFASSGAWI